MIPYVIGALIGLVVGGVVWFPLGIRYRKQVYEKEISSAEEEGTRIIIEAIKSATEAVNKEFGEIGSKVYGQAGGQAGPGPDMGGGFTGGPQPGGQQGGDGVVDADYEVIDDDQK